MPATVQHLKHLLHSGLSLEYSKKVLRDQGQPTMVQQVKRLRLQLVLTVDCPKAFHPAQEEPGKAHYWAPVHALCALKMEQSKYHEYRA
jgi:hypothetical protein